jgi:hypothetical protein
MATSKLLSIAQTGSNFENFNFFVVFSAYRVQKSIMLNLSHTNKALMEFFCINGIFRHISAFFLLNAHFCITKHPRANVATPRVKATSRLVSICGMLGLRFDL